MSRFAVIPVEAGDRCRGDTAALAILYGLALHADKLGHCWPSRKTLAEVTGLSERNIQRVLKRLEDNGVIEIIQKGSGRESSIYALKCDFWTKSRGDNLSPQGGQYEPSGETGCLPRGDTVSPEHTIEQTIKKKAIGRDEFLPEGWQPSADNLGKLKAKYPGMNADAIVEAFIDYWQSRGDARAKKRDWNAALRVWFSNEAKRSPSNVKRNYKPGFTEEDRRRLLESADRAVAGTSAVHDFFGKRGCADR